MEGPAGRRVPAGRVRTRMIGDFRLVAVTVVLLGLVGSCCYLQSTLAFGARSFQYGPTWQARASSRRPRPGLAQTLAVQNAGFFVFWRRTSCARKISSNIVRI